jgi:hypothetical protein
MVLEWKVGRVQKIRAPWLSLTWPASWAIRLGCRATAHPRMAHLHNSPIISTRTKGAPKTPSKWPPYSAVSKEYTRSSKEVEPKHYTEWFIRSPLRLICKLYIIVLSPHPKDPRLTRPAEAFWMDFHNVIRKQPLIRELWKPSSSCDARMVKLEMGKWGPSHILSIKELHTPSQMQDSFFSDSNFQTIFLLLPFNTALTWRSQSLGPPAKMAALSSMACCHQQKPDLWVSIAS